MRTTVSHVVQKNLILHHNFFGMTLRVYEAKSCSFIVAPGLHMGRILRALIYDLRTGNYRSSKVIVLMMLPDIFALSPSSKVSRGNDFSLET